MKKAAKKSQTAIKKILPILEKVAGRWPTTTQLTIPEIIARALFEQGFTELEFVRAMAPLKHLPDPFTLTILNTIRSLELGNTDKDSIPLIDIDLFDCKR